MANTFPHLAAQAAKDRARNKEHCAKIDYEIVDAIVKHVFSGENYTGDSDTQIISEEIVEAIAKGEIPHIKIVY
ncbi:MAG: hypothetical protein ACUZ8H_15495 [Candidatus Anammoxibacter sp.]